MLHCEFISGAANTSGHGVLWLDGEVAYGCSNLVCLARHEPAGSKVKVTRSLRRHAGRINALASTKRDGVWTLYSAADDGLVVVWRSEEAGWTAVSSIEVKTPLMLITAMTAASGDLLFTADAEGGVFGFVYTDTTAFEAVQTLNFAPAQTPNEIHLCGLAEEVAALFVGGVDGHVVVYAGRVPPADPRQMRLELVGSLSGHEDWVTSIDHCLTERGLLVASGSQDAKIRLWQVSTSHSTEGVSTLLELVETQHLEEEDEVEEEGADLIVEESSGEARVVFQVSKTVFSISLEALLIGHEDWVTSVHFLPFPVAGIRPLVSTSMDRNIIIWLPDPTSGIWVPSTRMGDVGGTLGGAVGANLLGFVSGTVSPHENMILGVGYGGSFHLWAEEKLSKKWVPKPFVTGHFGAVNDAVWSSHGQLLLTASSDQTCRIFAHNLDGEYIELSRPQVHGYDINCLALSPDSLTLYSGGDEKIVRIFEAPGIVIQGVRQLTLEQVNFVGNR